MQFKPTYAAIRLNVTSDVGKASIRAKKMYPALSDPEILKLGLSKIVTEGDAKEFAERERAEIRRLAASSLGKDYLSDRSEDVHTKGTGKRAHFS